MVKSEKQVKRAITLYFNKLLAEGKIEYWNRIISASKNGVPDMFIILGGTTYFFEIKSATGKTTQIQDYVISRINARKKIAYVVNDLEVVKKIINGIIEEKSKAGDLANKKLEVRNVYHIR